MRTIEGLLYDGHGVITTAELGRILASSAFHPGRALFDTTVTYRCEPQRFVT